MSAGPIGLDSRAAYACHRPCCCPPAAWRPFPAALPSRPALWVAPRAARAPCTALGTTCASTPPPRAGAPFDGSWDGFVDLSREIMRGRNSKEQQETVAGVLAGLLPPQVGRLSALHSARRRPAFRLEGFWCGMLGWGQRAAGRGICCCGPQASAASQPADSRLLGWGVPAGPPAGDRRSSRSAAASRCCNAVRPRPPEHLTDANTLGLLLAAGCLTPSALPFPALRGAGAGALPPLVPAEQAQRRVQRLHHGAGLRLAGGALAVEGGGWVGRGLGCKVLPPRPGGGLVGGVCGGWAGAHSGCVA